MGLACANAVLAVHCNYHNNTWSVHVDKNACIIMYVHAHVTAPVCHQVSTTVQRPSPTTLWYHNHASSFRGSPTDKQEEARMDKKGREGEEGKMGGRMNCLAFEHT